MKPSLEPKLLSALGQNAPAWRRFRSAPNCRQIAQRVTRREGPTGDCSGFADIKGQPTDAPLREVEGMKARWLIAIFGAALIGAALSYAYTHAAIGVTEPCRRSSPGEVVCPSPYKP
jgi:hypothetical protein